MNKDEILVTPIVQQSPGLSLLYRLASFRGQLPEKGDEIFSLSDKYCLEKHFLHIHFFLSFAPTIPF